MDKILIEYSTHMIKVVIHCCWLLQHLRRLLALNSSPKDSRPKRNISKPKWM